MEYVILGAILIAFSSLSSQLNSIKNKLDNQTKTRINLKDYLGKNVKLYLDDEYDIELTGEILSYDNKWFEFKENNKHKKSTIHYKRVDNIKSITSTDKE